MAIGNEPTFTCTKCGQCCRGFSADRGVVLFPRDVFRLAARLDLSVIEFLQRFCQPLKGEGATANAPLYRLNHKNGDCIFLEDAMTCAVYEERPTQCERSPFRFFWNGSENFQYDCVKGVVVPDDWSSDKFDRELVAELQNAVILPDR